MRRQERKTRKGWAALILALPLCSAAAAPQGERYAPLDWTTDRQQERDRDRACPAGREVRLINGRIHTMDAADRVVSEVTIRNGRFTSVGTDGTPFAPGRCKEVIDLAGRTATPGLIDNHNHIVLLGLRPGYHTPLEVAASVDDIAAIYRERIPSVPRGAFITTIGGFSPVQLAQQRLPTLSELDVIAPDNPVYLQVSFAGPAVTNSAGKAFFVSRGVEVGPDGSIAANAPTLAALNALRSIQSFHDKKRSTMDAMLYAASLGLTTHLDMGGFSIPGTSSHEDEFAFDGAGSWDVDVAYDPLLELHRKGGMKVRVRVFFLSMRSAADAPILPRKVEHAFRNGDDWLRLAGVGEFITSWPLFGPATTPANYPTALRMAAEQGWAYQQHTLSSAEDEMTINAWEEVNTSVPIAPLHWSIAHAPAITPNDVQRLKSLGAGLALHGFRYLAGSPGQSGPPYRMIVDSGIKVGAGSDAAQISTLNPWLMLYYMTTGKNSSGVPINADQTLTRQEALRLYTRENGWFSKEESKLGSIEPGKLADLVVLNADYFAVPDEGLRHIESVLTLVGGKIVYDTGAVTVSGR